jgi:hypothetical protein
MKRQRFNILSHAERVEPNRQLKDAMDASPIVPTIVSSARQFFLFVKLMARYVYVLTTVALTR